MWHTAKDYLTATFYLAGSIVLAALIFMMGTVILIPLLFYGTYKILQIRRQLRNQNPEQSNGNYTALNRDRTESHQDR